MAAPHLPVMTAADYLEIERVAEFKSEFYNGQMVAMAGARKSHIRIVANLMRHIGNALAGTPCEPMSNDLRFAADPSSRYFYPDVVIACEDARFLDELLDTILDPVVVIEVESGSTKAIDRTVKLEAYLQVSSVQDYVIIDSRSITIDRYSRQGEAWLFTSLHDGMLDFESLGVHIPFEHIYERVNFADED